MKCCKLNQVCLKQDNYQINSGDSALTKIPLQSTKGHEKGEKFNQLNNQNDSSGTQIIKELLITHYDKQMWQVWSNADTL